MGDIVNFEEHKRAMEYRRIAQLFNVIVHIGTNDEYEIDMECNDEYDNWAIFKGIEVLYARFGIEHGFLGADDDQKKDE